MPKKPCHWCGEPIPSGQSEHRCPQMEAALKDLKAVAGVEDEDDDGVE